MAYTNDQLNKLDSAIALGALEVDYGDKKVVYRSLAEMLRIRALMCKELGISSDLANRRYAAFSKGLKI